MGLFTRAIRPPPDDITPNPNDPASVPPSTVGPDQLVTPGDPNGVELVGDPAPAWIPPAIIPSAWSGWPAEWWPPLWGNQRVDSLADTAWMCIDLNANLLATMPPYLVDAAPSLTADWLRNPNPDIYSSWEEFAKQLFWDYHLGEAFVLATARYSTGWPAHFHVVPPWLVNVELDQGRRRYSIGEVDVTPDILHLRYQSSVDDAHGHGPLEVGQARLTAARVLTLYGTRLAAGGGIPAGILHHPNIQSEAQAAELKMKWLAARGSSIGEPAVLSGGITWEATQVNPTDMALLELLTFNESRIAQLLGVPPELVGLVPSGGSSLTYKTALHLLDFHWRAYLRPKAQTVMSGLSGWLLPRATRVEVNRDAYVQPEPLERAQTAEILHRIVDPVTGQHALSVEEIRASERLNNSMPEDLASGVLK